MIVVWIKNTILTAMCFLLLFSVVGCSSKQLSPDEREIMQHIEDKNFDKAKYRTMYLFAKDEEKKDELLSLVEEARQKHNDKIKLVIQEGYTYEIDGEYIYINGRVKNISNYAVNYYEVICKFQDDSGNVVDSTYTNSGLAVQPGEMQAFEIMHKYRDDFRQFSLVVGKIR